MLLEHARRKNRRNKLLPRVGIDDLDPAATVDPGAVDHEAIGAALDKLLALDARRHRVVMLKFYGGLDEKTIAEAIGMDVKTVGRDWATAKLFLRAELKAYNQTGPAAMPSQPGAVNRPEDPGN